MSDRPNIVIVDGFFYYMDDFHSGEERRQIINNHGYLDPEELGLIHKTVKRFVDSPQASEFDTLNINTEKKNYSGSFFVTFYNRGEDCTDKVMGRCTDGIEYAPIHRVIKLRG